MNEENNPFRSFSDEELQRKELERLLSTATDESRKLGIQTAIANLDIFESNGIITTSPTRNQFHSKIPLDSHQMTSSSGRTRPLSAQRRRPSITSFLDAIPENRTLLHRGTIDRFSEVDLTIDDIEDISSSSYDARYPPKNVFKNSLALRRGWIPTGLVPQCLFMKLNVKWLIRKIEIICIGVDEIDLTVVNGRQFTSTDTCIKMERKTENLFVYIAEQGSSLEPAGIEGNKIFTTFKKSSEMFFYVIEMKITSLPCNSS